MRVSDRSLCILKQINLGGLNLKLFIYIFEKVSLTILKLCKLGFSAVMVDPETPKICTACSFQTLHILSVMSPLRY